MYKYLGLIFTLLVTTGLILFFLKLKLPNRRIIVWLTVLLTLAMLVFDSYLTALPIVEYNKNLVLGIHIGPIPIEDFGYLIVIILLGPALFERFVQNEKQ